MYYFYILRCSDDSLYCGIARDLEKRLREHNSQTSKTKYTRVKRPVYIVHYEKFESRGKALKREAEVKKWPKSQKGSLSKYFLQYQKICDIDHRGFCLLTIDVLNAGFLAPKTRAKIVQFHDKKDKVVPFAHGKLLFEKLGSKDKKFFEHGGTHRFFNIRNSITKE